MNFLILFIIKLPTRLFDAEEGITNRCIKVYISLVRLERLCKTMTLTVIFSRHDPKIDMSTLSYIPPDVASGEYFHGRGVFSATNYFSKYIHLTVWSFYRAFIELGQGYWR